jgi:hypothetical protein
MGLNLPLADRDRGLALIPDLCSISTSYPHFFFDGLALFF